MKVIRSYILCILVSYAFFLKAEQVNSSDLQNQRRVVFLTGAAGFIGSNFLTYMYDKYPNYHFLVLDALTYAGNLDNIPDHIKSSKRFEFFHDSVTNQEIVDYLMQKAHFVVHFAAESHVTRSILNDKTFVETDVMGTQKMLHSLVKHPHVERFIHISTSEVYGSAETEPMPEEHPLNARSPYAAAKAGADRLVYSYCCTYDVPAVIVRPFNNFGPKQHLEKVIPRFITSAIRGRSLTVHGGGYAKRDWVHVLDTCEALDKILHIQDFDSIKHQVINIGTGKAVSILDIAQQILKHFDLPESYIEVVGDRPGQVACHISSTEKAKKLLDWEAKRSLEDSLSEVINWYKDNQQWWSRLEMMQWVPVYSHLSRKTEMQ